MKGRPSSNYYRRRNDRRKKAIRKAVVIVLIVALLLFALFLVVGNILNKKITEDIKSKGKTEATELDKSGVAEYSIQAYPINLRSEDISSDFKALSAASVGAVSVRVTNDNGELLISSDVAQSFGFQTKGESLADLSSILTSARYYGMFSSAALDLNYYKEEDPKLRTVVLAYEAALACELVDKGVGEVVVRLSEADEATLDDLIAFARSVESINENAVIGVALPIDYFKSASATDNVAALAEHFAFMSIDISALPDGTESVLSHIEASVSDSTLKYHILRYNMRIVLPELAEEYDAELKEILSENSISNWQKIS